MGNLFEELKRRNVVRVGAAYAVVGWIIMQVIDVVIEPLRLPEWTATLVLVLLLVGLPITLFLAWAFEMTPEGVKKTGEVDADASITPATGQKLNRFIMGALVVGLVYFVWESRFQEGDQPPPTDVTKAVEVAEVDKSIAVLPFADMSPEGDQEYFADGISEELLNALVKLPGLKVSGRTSSFQFKGQNLDLPLIGQQLGVTTILEGSVRTQGNRVRITAQLINAADGFHLWSETYDRDMSDIFAVQDEIATAIVAALRVELTGEVPTLVTVGTANMEAYDFYLRGRSEFAKRSDDGLLAATAALEEAVRLDPSYADAWATLSLVYGVYTVYSVDAPAEEVAAKRRHAAETAIAIDPDNARALLASAWQKHHDWDWRGAERDFVRGLTLSPNDAELNNFYGDHLLNLMDNDHAIAVETRVTELDPLFAIGWFDLGLINIFAGHYDEGLRAVARGRALDPDMFFGYAFAFYAAYYSGQTQEARQAYEEWKRRAPGSLNISRWEPLLAIREGDIARANALIDAKLANPELDETDFYDVGLQLYEAGRFEEAYNWLNKAYADRAEDFTVAFPGELGDPRVPIKDPAIAEIFSRPGLKEMMDIRRRNLGLGSE